MTIQDILARRSVRKFTNEPITEEEINGILRAAMAAPSAMSLDPWSFIVVTERELLDKLAGALPYGSMLKSATAAVIVCGNKKKSFNQSDDSMIFDCAAATENLCLAATALSLGSCCLAISKIAEIFLNRMFSIPEDERPIIVVALGRPVEKTEPRTRFDSAKIHHNIW